MYHCQRKCSVDLYWFYHYDHDYTYRVMELELTIGDFTLKYNVCQYLYGTWSWILNINCLSWTQGKMLAFL